MRLDQQLVDRGLAESREKAQRAILAGQVRLNGQVADKPGRKVKPEDQLELSGGDRFVSRGGHKLHHALIEFALDVHGVRAVDIGASTGGFTDCLLQLGAASVAAVDVGRGQLAWKLRQDPRVQVLEGLNARHAGPAAFGPDYQPFDLAVLDCSFISLRLVLPPVVRLVRPGGRLVALVKPQFEAGREEADRGRGVIADPAIHRRVLDELRAFVGSQPGLQWLRETESPLLGPAGNKEFLILLETTPSTDPARGTGCQHREDGLPGPPPGGRPAPHG
ncbi:MAG: TlyA family RNA methyltransferase [Verrucomicrobiales bacterium]|nr:TlyA family RNA methyltransferase [Verrucomicrobiales bacterium]